jgi:hypothetical protein
MIDGSAFAPTISAITVENGNRHFRVSGAFLLDFSGISIIRYFGSDPNVALARHIEILNPGCFCGCESLRSLIFQSGSRLRRIEAYAFHDCSSLESICLPASVDLLGDDSFYGCNSLRSFTFEPDSQLRQIGARPFYGCTSLRSISAPALTLSRDALRFGQVGSN